MLCLQHCLCINRLSVAVTRVKQPASATAPDWWPGQPALVKALSSVWSALCTKAANTLHSHHLTGRQCLGPHGLPLSCYRIYAAVSCILCARQLEVDSRPEAFTEVEKVMPKLMVAIDDAHFKVGRLYTHLPCRSDPL